MVRSRRDRRGHGMRGPAILPVESAAASGGPPGPPRPSRRERFDRLALTILTEVDARWQDHLGLVEYAVEDSPMLPHDWSTDAVPLSSLVRGHGDVPTRLVLFRRPIEHRAQTRDELEALVVTVVVEQIAELLGLPAEDVDPRYRGD